jgi:hypothetical protein
MVSLSSEDRCNFQSKSITSNLKASFGSPGTTATWESTRRNIFVGTVPAHSVRDTARNANSFQCRRQGSRIFARWGTMPSNSDGRMATVPAYIPLNTCGLFVLALHVGTGEPIRRKPASFSRFYAAENVLYFSNDCTHRRIGIDCTAFPLTSHSITA